MKHLSVHLTDLCNSKCSFCVVASPMYVSDSVDYQGIVRFLEAHSSQDYEAGNLHVGEPTISPRFFDTLALIKRLGYREIHLQTNGIRLANEDFAARTVDAGVTLLIVSLHAADPAVQDKLTHSPGGFEKTLRGDASPAVRADAALALADVAAEEALATLLVAVEDEDERVRQMALTAMPPKRRTDAQMFSRFAIQWCAAELGVLALLIYSAPKVPK